MSRRDARHRRSFINAGSGGGAGDLLPSDIPGLVLWLRSDTGVTTVMSAVAAAGTAPPAVTLTGVPIPGLSVEIDITTPGLRGVALFQWKLGGVVQATLQLTGANVTLNSTLVAQFPAGTYSADNVYTATVQVSAWSDQSGNGNNVLQATSANQPGYTVNDISWAGRPSLAFGGTQWLAAGATLPNLAQPSTIYAMCLLTSNGTPQWAYDGQTARCAILWNGTPVWTTFAGTSLIGTTAASRAASVTASIFNGASSQFFQNNSATNLEAGNPGAANLQGVVIGAATNFSSAITGSYAEFVAYAGAHTAAQRALIFRYAAARYGQAWG
jgi:hypothetical protein